VTKIPIVFTIHVVVQAVSKEALACNAGVTMKYSIQKGKIATKSGIIYQDYQSSIY
jgi:hypothetical protein